MTGRRSTKLAGEVELKRWGPCYIRNKLVFNPRSSSAAWHYALTEVLTSQRKQEDAAPSAQPLRPRNTAAFHLLGIEPGIMWDSQAAAEAPRKKNRGQTMLKSPAIVRFSVVAFSNVGPSLCLVEIGEFF